MTFRTFFGLFRGPGSGGPKLISGDFFETFRVFGVLGSVDGGGDLLKLRCCHLSSAITEITEVWLASQPQLAGFLQNLQELLSALCTHNAVATPTQRTSPYLTTQTPWWTFRKFFIFFFLVGEGGKGSPRRREGRGRFFIEKARRGGGLSRRGKGRGAGRVSAANWGIFWGGGGGLNIFFRGRNVHQDSLD